MALSIDEINQLIGMVEEKQRRALEPVEKLPAVVESIISELSGIDQFKIRSMDNKSMRSETKKRSVAKEENAILLGSLYKLRTSTQLENELAVDTPPKVESHPNG